MNGSDPTLTFHNDYEDYHEPLPGNEVMQPKILRLRLSTTPPPRHVEVKNSLGDLELLKHMSGGNIVHEGFVHIEPSSEEEDAGLDDQPGAETSACDDIDNSSSQPMKIDTGPGSPQTKHGGSGHTGHEPGEAALLDDDMPDLQSLAALALAQTSMVRQGSNNANSGKISKPPKPKPRKPLPSGSGMYTSASLLPGPMPKPQLPPTPASVASPNDSALPAHSHHQDGAGPPTSAPLSPRRGSFLEHSQAPRSVHVSSILPPLQLGGANHGSPPATSVPGFEKVVLSPIQPDHHDPNSPQARGSTPRSGTVLPGINELLLNDASPGVASHTSPGFHPGYAPSPSNLGSPGDTYYRSEAGSPTSSHHVSTPRYATHYDHEGDHAGHAEPMQRPQQLPPMSVPLHQIRAPGPGVPGNPSLKLPPPLMPRPAAGPSTPNAGAAGYGPGALPMRSQNNEVGQMHRKPLQPHPARHPLPSLQQKPESSPPEVPSNKAQPTAGSPLGTFKCNVPGCTALPFITQYLLNSHANVHSDDRPHYCSVAGCPRSRPGNGFKRKNEMIRHGLVHKSPGYVCPFCPDREHKYPRPDNLLRHVKAHHKDRNKDDALLREVLAQRPDGPSRGRRRRNN